MAHEVEIRDGKGSMFSARETPWHGLGEVTDGVLTAADAIKAANIDWLVEKHPIFRKVADITEDGVGEKFVEVPDRFALERNIDGKLMSVVSDRYKPFQNHEAFSFMDGLTGSGEAKYETAGSLREGKTVFISLAMENSDFSVAGEDPHKTFLLLRTTHDGSGRISIYVVTVRVVCMNTLTWAINGAKHTWGVTHTADVRGKVAEARQALGLTAKYTAAFQHEAEQLLEDVRITDDDIRKLLESTMPERPTREREVESIIELHSTSKTIADAYRGTGWGFLNAVSEYTEHQKANKSKQASFMRVMDGQYFGLRSDLKTRLLASV